MSMSVYVCVCVYTYEYLHAYICAHKHPQTNTYQHTYTYVYVYIHTSTQREREGGEKEGGERLLGIITTLSDYYYSCLCFTCEVKNILIFSIFSCIIQSICTESQSPVVFFQTSLSRSFCYSWQHYLTHCF